MDKIAEAAKELIRQGLVIIPLASHDNIHEEEGARGKRPLQTNWSNRQSTSEAEVDEWLQCYGRFNIGCVLRPSGLVCFDVDPRNGGLEWYNEHSHLFALGLVEVSGRGDGGKHIYYRCDYKEDYRKSKIAKGIDFLAGGSQVVIAPSIHALTGKGNWFVEPFLTFNDVAYIEDDPDLRKFLKKHIKVVEEVVTDRALSQRDERVLLDMLKKLDPNKGRHHQMGGWIHNAVIAGMEDHRIVDLADQWMADNGRDPMEQPLEIVNWIRDARRKVSGGGAGFSPNLRTDVLLSEDAEGTGEKPPKPLCTVDDTDPFDAGPTVRTKTDVLDNVRKQIVQRVSNDVFTNFTRDMTESQVGNIMTQNVAIGRDIFHRTDALMNSGMMTDGVDLTNQPWSGELIHNNRGVIEKCATNIFQLLRYFPPLQGLFIYNQFTDQFMLTRQPPWETQEVVTTKGLSFGDQHLAFLTNYVSRVTMSTMTKAMVYEALEYLRAMTTVHPVREYLESLTWDGKERALGLCTKYLKCTGDREDYLQTVSRVWIMSMIARAFQAGCKCDYVPVLTSRKQGLGKSTSVQVLGAPWTGELVGDLHNKDTILALRGKWLLELSEMDSINRSVETFMKAFLTRTFDTVRDPYGRIPRDVPRSCVFVGTSNNLTPLTDPTGNRRFLMTTMDQMIDREGLILDREQIFAEAVAMYRGGERWDMTMAEEDLAQEAQAKRLAVDHLAERAFRIATELMEKNDGEATFEAILCRTFRASTVAEIKPGDAHRVRRGLIAYGLFEEKGNWLEGVPGITAQILRETKDMRKINEQGVTTQVNGADLKPKTNGHKVAEGVPVSVGDTDIDYSMF